MKIYVYKEDKSLLRKFRVDDEETKVYLLNILEHPSEYREFIAEELFNNGYRKESAEVSFILTSL